MWQLRWSIAVYDLGLTTEQFYLLTPRQLHALVLRHNEANERVEMLMGISTAAIVNHSFNTPKEAKCPADFMPSMYAKREKDKPKKKFSRKKFADSVRGMFKTMAALDDPRNPRIKFIPAPEKGAEKEG